MATEIIVVGSLEPQKAIQDECRVVDGGGISPTVRARDYKGPIKVLIRNEQRKDTESE